MAVAQHLGGSRIIAGLLALLVPCVAAGTEEPFPTVLSCTSNAKVTRHFDFPEKEWDGDIGSGAHSGPFSVGTPESPDGLTLRDAVFAGLDSKHPTLRYIRTADRTREEHAEEIRGVVVSRDGDAVWILWKNPPGNKVLLAVVNLTHKKAVMGHLQQGYFHVGGEMETLDCR